MTTMKPLKIVLWLLVSFTLGKVMNFLFSPTELLYSSMLSIAPFIAMGFQQDIKTIRSSFSIFGKKFRVKAQTIKINTFWGIPVGQPEALDTLEEWFPDTTPHQALEGVFVATETLIESAIKGVLFVMFKPKALPKAR